MPFPADRASRSYDARASSSRPSRPANKFGGKRPTGPRSPDKRRETTPIPVVDPSEHSAAFAALGVPSRLLDALSHACIDTPFPVQSAALPDALAGRDVLGRAPTGSGKTLAYGLALLARCPQAAPKAPKALILVPTRELAKQVAQVLVPYARATDRWVTAFFGGAGLHHQIDDLRRGTDIAVATPGRLIDLVNRGDCRLDEVELLVIDEADRMADMGFTPQVRELMDQVNEKRQILFFSATLDGDVDELVKHYLNNPVVHEIDGSDDDDDAGAQRAQHLLVVTKHERKFQDLAELLGDVKRAIVFVKNRFATERVADALDSLGVKAFAMHGGMTQNAREGALKRWAQGESVALVATDVAARGVHVAGVEVVVHMDPPQEEKDYIHRSGRTARAGETGLVVNFYRKEQLRPAALMHKRLGFDVAQVDMAGAKAALAELALARGTAGASTSTAPVATPAHETWTNAELSVVDEHLDAAPSRPAYRDRDAAPARASFQDRDARSELSDRDTRKSSNDRPGSWERDRDRAPRVDGPRGPRTPSRPEGRGYESRPGASRPFESRPFESRPSAGRPYENRTAGARDGGARESAARGERDRPWTPGGPRREGAPSYGASPRRDDFRRDGAPSYGTSPRRDDRPAWTPRPAFEGRPDAPAADARRSWRDDRRPASEGRGPSDGWRSAPRGDSSASTSDSGRGRPVEPAARRESGFDRGADRSFGRGNDRGERSQPSRPEAGNRWSAGPGADRDRPRPAGNGDWKGRPGAPARTGAPGAREQRPWTPDRPARPWTPRSDAGAAGRPASGSGPRWASGGRTDRPSDRPGERPFAGHRDRPFSGGGDRSYGGQRQR